jgi:Sulfatase
MKYPSSVAITGVLAIFLATIGVGRAQEVLPRPEPLFKGHIGPTVQDSTLDFPQQVKAPQGAPNILLILTDDVGFGASSAFGGPIPTPSMDRLAKEGLRYTQFHTTALCSPTRAALLTGRNHHSNSTGVIMELATGFPGYNSLNAEEQWHFRGGPQTERVQHGLV